MTTETSATCKWLYRLWMILTLAWLAFIAWRTLQGWPTIPLDMGGADAETAAAYHSAQIDHALNAAALALGAPLVIWLVLKLICRTRRV